ncbi:hypothetical protein U1Q18_022545, partial [Sarracenia purpurea var. burkii]
MAGKMDSEDKSVEPKGDEEKSISGDSNLETIVVDAKENGIGIASSFEGETEDSEAFNFENGKEGENDEGVSDDSSAIAEIDMADTNLLGEEGINPPLVWSSDLNAKSVEGHSGEDGAENEQRKAKNQAVLVRLGGDNFSPFIDVKSDGLNPTICNVENGMKSSCLSGSKENQAMENEIPINHAHKVFAKMPLPTFAQDTAEITYLSNKMADPKGFDELLANKAQCLKGREDSRLTTDCAKSWAEISIGRSNKNLAQSCSWGDIAGANNQLRPWRSISNSVRSGYKPKADAPRLNLRSGSKLEYIMPILPGIIDIEDDMTDDRTWET